MKPEISIIIPTYNSEDYIAQALESVFAQTYDNFEIILVDDASTDSTLEIARNFGDRRLKIIANKQNGGVSRMRNCGIKQAKGNWIALLDSDDWYAPERLEKLLEVALKHNADLVADDLFLIRDREQYPWSTLLQENQTRKNAIELVDGVRFVMTERPTPINAPRNWSFGYTKPLIKREFLLQHHLEYDESINLGEDFVLYFKCLQNKARFLLIPRPYYYYRIREVSLSTKKPTEYLSQYCKMTQSFIEQELVAENVDRLLIEAMYQNLRIFQKRLAYYRAVEYLKQKKVVNTLVQIIKCPYILIYFSNKLITILENKTLAISSTRENQYVSWTFD
jgi:succinoglycan biosynthesis protein ExoO